MKNKMEKVIYQFNLRMNKEEWKVLRLLKDEYEINVSGTFKRFLKRQLKSLQENDKDI